MSDPLSWRRPLTGLDRHHLDNASGRGRILPRRPLSHALKDLAKELE